MSYASNVIQCTAGAVPFRNEKGEISMKKVKVNRYVAGKAPDYYNYEDMEMSDNDVSDNRNTNELQYNIAFPDRTLLNNKDEMNEEMNVEDNDDEDDVDDDVDDPRLRRLYKSGKPGRNIEMLEDSESETEEDRVAKHLRERQTECQSSTELEGYQQIKMDEEEEEDEEEDEEKIAMRRQLAREKALVTEQDTVLSDFVDDINEEEIEYSDDYETDSDNERQPKLKPIFVRAQDRVTINKSKQQLQKEIEDEQRIHNAIKEQRQVTKTMIEDANREEIESSRNLDDAVNAISSDIENDEEEYELWKVRELKRIKRDRQEREQSRKETEEINRIRKMTEDERLNEFKKNPKIVTNQQVKGKLKFMQKYYHRGAYYVTDKEESVLQRDFTAPTLEDNFNVTNLPLVKQVKNFGKAGRTKYTHLVDQDTTDYDSGWGSKTSHALRFYNTQGGGMKQVFEKPRSKKK